MSFLPEMLVPVLVLVVAPTQRPNPTEARPGHGDQPPRVRRPLAGRPDSARPPPAHEPISDFGQRFPLGAMSPQHTPALAHNALKPQAIARRRAFRKATHRFALDRRPCVSAHVCRARARAQQRATSTTAVLQGFGWFCPGVRHGVSPSASRRQPPPRSTSRPRAPGHPPARADPRLSRPLGRSHLSAGGWKSPGVLGPPGPLGY